MDKLSQGVGTHVGTTNSRADGTTWEAWETCQWAGGKKLTDSVSGGIRLAADPCGKCGTRDFMMTEAAKHKRIKQFGGEKDLLAPIRLTSGLKRTHGQNRVSAVSRKQLAD